MEILQEKKFFKYFEKILITGNIVEVWRYEHLNVKGGGNTEGKTTDGEHQEENYEVRQKRRRNRIRQLVCTNFDSGSKFVTLTFHDHHDFDIRDVKACNRYFAKFIMRLKYRYHDLKYVAVIEFQDANGRGAVHYHMICNLPYIKKAELADIWGAGFVKINRIDKVDNVGAYVVKYMCKDTEDKRLCGENAYLHSRYLAEPTEVNTWSSDISVWEQLHDELEKNSPSYGRTYKSEHCGEVSYFQYNFNKKVSQDT